MYVYLIACTNHTKLATTIFLDKAAILFSISISRKLTKMCMIIQGVQTWISR